MICYEFKGDPGGKKVIQPSDVQQRIWWAGTAEHQIEQSGIGYLMAVRGRQKLKWYLR